ALALMLWGAGLTAAAVAQQPVKLGVLNDQSGLYADLTGMGSVHAARMAVEDYAARCWAGRSKSSSPTTRTSPTSAPTSRDNGSRPRASTSSSTFPIRPWGSPCAR